MSAETEVETKRVETPPPVGTNTDFHHAADRLRSFLEARAGAHERRLQQELGDEGARLLETNPASGVFRLLSALLSMHMQAGNDAEPVLPCCRWGTGGR